MRTYSDATLAGNSTATILAIQELDGQIHVDKKLITSLRNVPSLSFVTLRAERLAWLTLRSAA